jgi:hypothetical protein
MGITLQKEIDAMPRMTFAGAAMTAAVVLVLGGSLTSVALRAEQPAEGDKLSANNLSMEALALKALYQFQLTPEQMKTLRPLAEKTAGNNAGREESMASARFKRALQFLRDALADAADDEAIAAAEEKLKTIGAAENPELDDDFELTDEARLRTSEILHLLKAQQVAAWIARNADEITDPRELLLTQVTKAPSLTGEEFTGLREAVAEDMGRLLAGIQTKKAEHIHDRVFALLTRAHDLSADEVALKGPELQKEAEEIVGRISAIEVIRHVLDLAVAQLLSNPRLGAALDARLK